MDSNNLKSKVGHLAKTEKLSLINLLRTSHFSSQRYYIFI